MKNCIHISIFCTDKANFFCIVFTQSMFQTIWAMLYIIYLAVFYFSDNCQFIPNISIISELN